VQRSHENGAGCRLELADNGTPLVLLTCNGLWNQVCVQGATGTLRNPASHTCLDTASQGSADLTGLQLRACALNSRSQIWTLPAS
jgi:hypothetical protein